MAKGKVRCICFDVGGTLLETTAPLSMRISQWLGLPIEAIRPAMKRYLYTSHGTHIEAWSKFCADIGVATTTEAEANILKTSDAPKIFDDVVPTLRELRDYTLCSVSNCTAWDRASFSELGLDRYFAHAFNSFEVGYMKPDSRFFREVELRTMLEPQTILIVGDSCKDDILGGKRVGWSTVYLNRGRGHCCPSADLLIRTLAELPTVLANMEGQSG